MKNRVLIQTLFVFMIMLAGAVGIANAQQTTITHTFKTVTDDPDPKASLTVFEVRRDGSVHTKTQQTFYTNASGQLLHIDGTVGIKLPRNSVARMYSNAPGFDDSNNGVWYVIPDAPTASLGSLERWVGGVFYLTATTGTGFTIRAPALTTGNAMSFVVPDSGFTGNILNVKRVNGTTLFNIDANGNLTVGGVVGGGSPTVEEVDGSPSILAATTIKFDQADGLVVSNPSGNIARIDLAAVPYSALALGGSIVNADINASAGIDASKLGDGTVSSTEFQRLDGVTSAIQTQINNRLTQAAADALYSAIGHNHSGVYEPIDANITRLGSSIDLSGAEATGILADARFPATLPAASGVNLTSLNASNIASGSLGDGRLSSNVALKNASNTFTGNNVFENIGVGGTATSAIKYINLNKTVSSGATGQEIILTATGTGIVIGANNEIHYSNVGTSIVQQGYLGKVYNDSTGTISDAVGLEGSAFNEGAGTITGAEGVLGFMTASNGTITTGCAVCGWSRSGDNFGDVGGAFGTLSLFQGKLQAGDGNINDLRGVSINGWGAQTGTIPVSQAIYIDNSVSVGATSYAIRSLSTSQSALAGDLTVSGLLKTGSGPTTLTDATGKILSAALNTAAVANGGTGATTAGGARTNLGVVIGTDVQPFNQNLADIAALADPNADRLLFWDDSAGAYKHLTLGANLSITGTTIDAAGGGGSGATIALDNLASVAINTSLISDTNNTDDLGSSAKKWKDGWFAGQVIAGTGHPNGFRFAGGSSEIIYSGGIGNITYYVDSTNLARMVAGELRINSTAQFTLASGDPAGTSADAGIGRDIANFVKFTDGSTGAGGFTLNEASSNPANPTADVKFRMYMKADKLVIQFNNGGTVRYFTLDLTQSGATPAWAQSTSAP